MEETPEERERGIPWMCGERTIQEEGTVSAKALSGRLVLKEGEKTGAGVW